MNKQLQEVRFSDAVLSNLLHWQAVRNVQEVFVIEGTNSGSVSTYVTRTQYNPQGVNFYAH